MNVRSSCVCSLSTKAQTRLRISSRISADDLLELSPRQRRGCGPRQTVRRPCFPLRQLQNEQIAGADRRLALAVVGLLQSQYGPVFRQTLDVDLAPSILPDQDRGQMACVHVSQELRLRFVG